MRRGHARRHQRGHDRAVDIVDEVERDDELVRKREGLDAELGGLRAQYVEEVEGADELHDRPADAAGDVEAAFLEGAFARGVVGGEPFEGCELYYHLTSLAASQFVCFFRRR